MSARTQAWKHEWSATFPKCMHSHSLPLFSLLFFNGHANIDFLMNSSLQGFALFFRHGMCGVWVLQVSTEFFFFLLCCGWHVFFFFCRIIQCFSFFKYILSSIGSKVDTWEMQKAKRNSFFFLHSLNQDTQRLNVNVYVWGNKTQPCHPVLLKRHICTC